MAIRNEEWLDAEADDEGAILYKVVRKAGSTGPLTALFRVYGRVKLPDGTEYECDRAVVRIRMKRCRKQGD